MSELSNSAFWPEVPGRELGSAYALHAQLMFTQWMDPKLFHSFQFRQLEKLLGFAQQNSPWYQSSLEHLASKPVGSLYPEHLAQLPVLSCKDLQQNGQKIIARERLSNHGQPHTVRILQPAGPAIRIVVNGLVEAWDRALDLRSQEWNESDVSMVNLDISGRLDKQKSQSGESRSILPWSGVSHHLSAQQPAGQLFDKLIRIDPGSLQTTPDILQSLVDLSALRGIKPENLREVHCRGHRPGTSVREKVEKNWGLSVIHEYHVNELGAIAHQCPERDHLHINSECFYVEILDENDRPCSIGQRGRIIVTPMQNFQTPLIRYDTGDYGQLGEPCSCGRSLPVLKEVSTEQSPSNAEG